jgi:uncharacterized membrane protein YfcA
MRMPEPVYESLPWLYVLGGIVAMAVGFHLHSGLTSTVLSLPGLLLLLAGAVIWLRRRNYRAIDREYLARGRAPDDEGI